jgi:hypothetical protein
MGWVRLEGLESVEFYLLGIIIWPVGALVEHAYRENKHCLWLPGKQSPASSDQNPGPDGLSATTFWASPVLEF